MKQRKAEQALLQMTAQLAEHQRLVGQQVQEQGALLDLERARSRKQYTTAFDTRMHGQDLEFLRKV